MRCGTYKRPSARQTAAELLVAKAGSGAAIDRMLQLAVGHQQRALLGLYLARTPHAWQEGEMFLTKSWRLKLFMNSCENNSSLSESCLSSDAGWANWWQ